MGGEGHDVQHANLFVSLCRMQWADGADGEWWLLSLIVVIFVVVVVRCLVEDCRGWGMAQCTKC